MITVHEDNAGQVFLYDGERILTVTGVVSERSGLADMVAFANGDTSGWIVPMEYGDMPDGHVIAVYDDHIRLWINEMGSAGLTYFGLDSVVVDS